MNRTLKILLGIGIPVAVLMLAFTAWLVSQSPIFRGPDAMFGDQHLKTTVALVELHRVRYGRYPQHLRELKFTGQWDPIATQSVSYTANAAGTRYCIEVQRGWVGKPQLTMPAEFWQGTGYDPTLCAR